MTIDSPGRLYSCPMKLLNQPIRRATALTLIAWLLVIPAGASVNGPDSYLLDFDVWLDSRRIGDHRFTVSRDGERREVASEARYRVKVAFLTLFRYDHEAKELWSAGCLDRLQARTRVGGERLLVDARTMPEPNAEGRAMRVQRGTEEAPEQTELTGCLGTYAYWDRQLMARTSLLNSQTGELDPVTLERLGRVSLPGNAAETAEAFNLATPDADIRLWYTDNGDWLALQTRTQERTLTYLRKSLGIRL